MKSENLYKRKDSQYWYYDVIDPVSRKRIRRSTKETDYNRAVIAYECATGLISATYAKPTSPFAALLAVYEDVKTNPRYLQAQIDGTSYGLQHAQRVASHARYLSTLIKAKLPSLYYKEIRSITKLDIKQIKALLVQDKGRCRQSQNVFQDLKTFFSQASEDDLLRINPAREIRNIVYEEKKRSSVEADKLALLIAAKDYFLRVEDWAYFTVLATTGMRRSEALALCKEQISDGYLNIDRALKSENSEDVGLPKCNVTRIIPLAEITKEALSAITPNKDGRYFPHGRYWVDCAFHRIQATACALYPEDSEVWTSITPHVLRHSLNTNLLCSGESPLLVAEYLSWSHQELIDMQARYTHIYASSMQSVAKKIDTLYKKESLHAMSSMKAMR